MPRPKRCRRIEFPPNIEGFKVLGGNSTDVVVLHFEEFEALRLCDYKKLSQEEAAQSMQVSRPTFTRIYDKTLKKIAEAFVEGKSIAISGGNAKFDNEWFRCHSCNKISLSEETCPKCKSEELSSINQELEGTFNGICHCPGCGHEEPHKKGVPCKECECPNCKEPLRRK